MKLFWMLLVFLVADAQIQQEEVEGSQRWKQFLQSQQQQCLAALETKGGDLEAAIFSKLANQTKEIVHKNQVQTGKKLEEFKVAILDDVKLVLESVALEMAQNISSVLTHMNTKLEEVHKRVDKCPAWKTKLGNLNLTRQTTGDYYFSNPNKLNWTEANQFCEDHGLKFLVISDMKEMEQISEVSPDAYEDYWVAASDAGQKPGNFTWPDGTEVDKFWWNLEEDQPNSYGPDQEVCVYFWPKGPNLFDFTCNLKEFFICKVDPKFTECI